MNPNFKEFLSLNDDLNSNSTNIRIKRRLISKIREKLRNNMF